MSATAAPARRQFQLFEGRARQGLPRLLKQPNELNCVAASSTTLFLGDTHGYVHSYRNGFEEGPVWQAYDKGRVTYILPVDNDVLFIAGEDSDGLPILKLYTFSGTSDGEPVLLKSEKLKTMRHPVTFMAVSSTLSHLAIGLGNGVVITYKHIRRLFDSATSQTGFGKSTVVHEGTDPITGLGFLTRQPTTAGAKASTSLLIATTSRISESSLNGYQSVVDETGGAKLGCAKMHQGKMLVARDEAIYVYGTDGKEGCYALEGSKQALHCLSSQNVLVLSPPSRTSMASQSATIRNFARAQPADAPMGETAKATIFDIENKFVAFSGTYDEPIRDAWELWGSVWLLTMDGKVVQLTEQPIATSLGLMYSKNLYTLAVSFAQTRGLPETQIAEIYKRYGDHLYTKADYDGAVGAYMKTISFVPPSHVIRKFLDAQRLSNLTSYLSELHSQGLANEDHTTLLLNCYTKLGDSEALSDFLNSSSQGTRKSASDDVEGEPGPPFDLETAIRVLRQANYYEHAVSLAERYNAHEDYLRIQLEDRQDVESALNHIRKGKLKPEEWKRYVAVLLNMKPKETTRLVEDVCCGTLGRSTNGYVVDGDDRPDAEMDVDEHEKLPPPKQFFAYFVDHPEQFVEFLERTLKGRYGIDIDALPALQNRDRSKAFGDDIGALCNTLIEAYAHRDDERQRRKAFKILKSELPYDDGQALLVCSQASYEDGIIYLYEKMGLHEDVVRYWMDKDDSVQVVKAVRKYGETSAALYALALRWLSASPERLDRHQRDLISMLDEADTVLPPIKVIQLLSRTAQGQDTQASVGLVRSFLERHLSKERQQADSDRALTESYRTESANKRREIQELNDPNAPRVFQVTRCSACGGQLDLPAVHFMCRHSYHQRCLGENEGECPNCARTHGVIREIRRANEQVAAKEDVFLSEVRESDDGYKAISDAFGRGFMSLVK